MTNRFGYASLSEQDRQNIIADVLRDNSRRDTLFLTNHNLVEIVTSQDDIFSPRNFTEYIGQKDQCEMLQIMLKAARKEHRPLPNILIIGPYGLGKTTLAKLTLRAFNNTSRMIDGNGINKTLPEPGTMIIDEIHNMAPPTCDSMNMLLDQGTHHVIGCTTDPGQLPPAFRSRFRTIQLDNYTVNDLTEIAKLVVRRKRYTVHDRVLEYTAIRSRFNARVLTNYLALMFDIIAVDGATLNLKVADRAFTMLGVDERGFLPRDRKYLESLPDRPVGLSYLSALLNTDASTIENEIEPYLLQLGLIDRTSKGRVKV